jgi:plastocyanin
MTWLWRICSSFLWLVPSVAATLTGQVELVDSRDPGVRKNRHYSGVVVWLEPLQDDPPAPPSKTVKMRQQGKKFTPHVLAIQVGTTVDFPNLDPIFHNAFSNFSGQRFDTGLYPPGTSQKVRFLREGIVRVFCNIHSSMSAVIVVTKTPYVAVTTRAGAFRIDGLPTGKYQMRIWQERATAASLKALERTIVIEKEEVKLPVLRISESGYLEVPHKNKYGRDYPPAPPEHLVYPGVRR